MTHACAITLSGMILVSATLVSAQDTRPPAKLVRVEGVAFLGDRTLSAAELPVVLPDTALIRTEEGRVVLSLKIGGTLALDHRTAVRVHANGVYNFNRIDIIVGRVVIESGASSPEVHCPDDAPIGPDSRTSQSLVHLSSRGRFRFERLSTGAAPPNGCVLRVQDGAAAVAATSLLMAARPGQELQLPYGDMIPVREFAVDDLDAFDRWARGGLR